MFICKHIVIVPISPFFGKLCMIVCFVLVENMVDLRDKIDNVNNPIMENIKVEITKNLRKIFSNLIEENVFNIVFEERALHRYKKHTRVYPERISCITCAATKQIL